MKHLKLLLGFLNSGLFVRTRVSGFKNTVTSLKFELTLLLQAILNKSFVNYK